MLFFVLYEEERGVGGLIFPGCQSVQGKSSCFFSPLLLMLFKEGGGRGMGKGKSNFIFFVLWFLVED